MKYEIRFKEGKVIRRIKRRFWTFSQAETYLCKILGYYSINGKYVKENARRAEICGANGIPF